MRKMIPAVAAAAVLVGSAGAYGITEALASDVVLSVDGQQSNVRTGPGTVGDVLAKQGISITEHDAVAPSVTTRVTNGTEISVRYGRPVTVTLDGQPTTQWITATTVDEALAQFGLRGELQVNTSRSTTIGRDGIQLDVSSPRNVTITVDGKTNPVKAIGTVTDALRAAGIVLGTRDNVTPAMETSLTDGTAITVQRVELRAVVKEVPVPFDKQKKDDNTLAKGTTKVTQKGVDGTSTETWTQEVRDGQVVNETRTSSVLTKQAQSEITSVGTKTTSTTSSSTSSSSNLTPATGNTCQASNYGEGQMTANGEVFNPSALTAAHKTLPFNTMVKVTNAANGKSVIVRINDRGPYVSGRCLDLSIAAFSSIASLSSGVITVNWEVV